MSTSKEIQLCQEIIALAIKANELESYNVWCNFSGHVSMIEVLITQRWTEGAEYLEDWSIGDKYAYLDDENALEKLEMIKGELIKFLER